MLTITIDRCKSGLFTNFGIFINCALSVVTNFASRFYFLHFVALSAGNSV